MKANKHYSIITSLFSLVLTGSLFILVTNKCSAKLKQPERINTSRSRAQSQAVTMANSIVPESLTTKENVDFLLTPALLTQEALSTDLLITYPSE